MNKRLIILSVSAVVVLGGGAVGAVKVLGDSKPGSARTHTAPPKVAYVEIREMTLRLADSGTEHYIKLDPVLAVRARDAEVMENKIPIVRDRILTVVTARTSSELSSPVGQRRLKEDLVTSLHKEFQDSLIDIYFSGYLVE
jgi:flagellar FliL protein